MTSTTSGPAGSASCEMPWSLRAWTSTQPKNTPTSSPRNVPNRAMMTASHRTVDRTWARVMPTARSRPISWVRSRIDSARVLPMPNTAMRIAISNSA